MKVGKIPIYSNRSNLSFASKVVYESSKPNQPLSKEIKDFIDKFEEANSKTKFNMGGSYLGEGVSSIAYYIPQYDFVLKQNKAKSKERYEKGSLYKENEILMSISPHVEHTQYGLGYVETEKGNKYLLSTLVQGKRADHYTNPYTEKKLDRLLRTLYRLDKEGIINTDLSGANILFTNDDYANIIDYQWGEKFNVTESNQFKYVALPQFEVPSNMTMFEGAAFAGYLETDDNPRSLLYNYLKIKSEYCTKRIKRLEEIQKETPSYYLKDRIKFEKAKAEAYKNPTKEVINAELLKIITLKEHRRQYTCIDPEIDKERNILETFAHCASASFASKTLEEYCKNINDPKNKEYFEYMSKCGEFYFNRNKNEYRPTLKWIANMCEGIETRTLIYYNKIEPTGEINSLFKHLDFGIFNINKYNNINFKNKINILSNEVNELTTECMNLYNNKNEDTYKIYNQISNIIINGNK